MVMKVSTNTESRSPEISVDDIGDHFISATPGVKSLVTAGICELTKTSHFSGLFIGFAQSFPVVPSPQLAPTDLRLHLPYPHLRSTPHSSHHPLTTRPFLHLTHT